jgi:hypothetical protein
VEETDKMRTVHRILIGLLLLFVFGGCAWMNRFTPNTMVKSYLPEEGQETPTAGGYGVDFMIVARDVGDTIGTDSFAFNIELRSLDKVLDESDTTRFAVPRVDHLTVYLPASADSIVLTGDRLPGHDLDASLTVSQGYIYEYFRIKGVVLPDLHEKIEVAVEFSFYDRLTHRLQRTQGVHRRFIRDQRLQWYRN